MGLVSKLGEQPGHAARITFNKKVRYSGAFSAFSGCEVVQVALFLLTSNFFREHLSDGTCVPNLLEDLALS